MNSRRPLTWLIVVVSFTLCGALSGHFLDRLFGWVSFDYIYRADQFLNGGSKVSLLLGTVTAASATVGYPDPAQLKKLLSYCLATLLSAFLLGAVGGLCGAGLSKWLVTGSAAVALAPRTRLWFCEGVWIGMLAGAVISCGILNIRLIWSRFQSQHN